MDDKPLSKNNLLIPFAIVFAGLIIGGAVYFGKGPRAQAPTTGTPQAAVPADISKVNVNGNPSVGNSNAPVTIAYWFDYQCPYCKLNEQDNVSKIVATYVQSGKVKIVFKDFEFLGPDSMSAAIAARAVWDVAPDKFYEWHSAMMNKQDAENGGWGNDADVIALTKTISGIDVAKVQDLVVSKKALYEKMIADDRTEGASFGINGTPGMIIGKQVIGGYVKDYSTFSTAIDALLK